MERAQQRLVGWALCLIAIFGTGALLLDTLLSEYGGVLFYFIITLPALLFFELKRFAGIATLLTYGTFNGTKVGVFFTFLPAGIWQFLIIWNYSGNIHPTPIWEEITWVYLSVVVVLWFTAFGGLYILRDKWKAEEQALYGDDNWDTEN